MQITRIRIHNYRSIINADLELQNYTLFVGANNTGKSNTINALRTFYDDLKWSNDDFPKIETNDSDAWMQVTFMLSDEEWINLAEKYKKTDASNVLTVVRYFKGIKAKPAQSNIYAIVDGIEDDELFYGAKNVSTAKIGNVVYIPAFTTPNEQMKTSGPSPLRNMLNFVLKKVVKKSEAYSKIESAFEAFNLEAKQDTGFLYEISAPINCALSQWDINLDLSVNPISTDEITKNLVKPSFVDKALGNVSFELERYGHGYQRSVIYELIKLAPTFKDDKESSKKEFNPDFNLILFEEPEAFLHPAQQEVMCSNLRMLSEQQNQQVIVTTHSQIFAGKNCDQLSQIVRLMKVKASTLFFQIPRANLTSLFTGSDDLHNYLLRYIEKPESTPEEKAQVSKFFGDVPDAEARMQRERFRYQIWLDTEKASMFFADKVLLVEGATERALLNYLFNTQWQEFKDYRVFIVDALGKFNYPRFMTLFEKFGIYHGVLLDDDNNKCLHRLVNKFIQSKTNKFTLASPVFIPGCLELLLKIDIPRNRIKPEEALRALESGKINVADLLKLKDYVCVALGITHSNDR